MNRGREGELPILQKISKFRRSNMKIRNYPHRKTPMKKKNNTKYKYGSHGVLYISSIIEVFPGSL